MEKAKIGENAGRIWHALNEVPEITLEDLAKKLELSENATCLSIGWLARENKVLFHMKEGKTYISNCNALNFAFG